MTTKIHKDKTIIEGIDEYKNTSKEPLTYFERLMDDVVNRTSTAMDQSHCLKVMECQPII
ncbi:hypothetical protein [Croceibacter atlanticus]|uniref:hypothetical protein n=1 Tax=Croceibacter atlanticus TaxID=313588 RepID=UPI0032B1F1FA